MQVIKTSNYGELTFVRTWTNSQIHIGKLKDGGYCHVGGPPVESKDELSAAIPKGDDLTEAFAWFDNKDKEPVEKDKPKIVIQKDGSYAFSDGSPIAGIGDLVGNIPKGPGLDAAVFWFVKQQDAKFKKEEDDKRDIQQRTEDALEERKKLTCVCGKVCAQPWHLESHQKACDVYKKSLEK